MSAEEAGSDMGSANRAVWRMWNRVGYSVSRDEVRRESVGGDDYLREIGAHPATAITDA